MGFVVGELLCIHSKVLINEMALSTVVSTGMPISTAFLRIRYSSYSIPTYFSTVDVDGMLIIKSIFLLVNRFRILGCLSGSLILWTKSTFLKPDFSKYSAVCSVARI